MGYYANNLHGCKGKPAAMQVQVFHLNAINQEGQ
jgi:hypothetical protein